MVKTLELVQALGSKICHDLAGSIGTIDNCLGLLDSHNKQVGDSAKDLVLEESKKLVKTIKFLRSTYGLVESESRQNFIDVIDILKNFYEDSSIKFNTHINGNLLDVEVNMAKVAYCLVAIAAENIASEGSIDLYISEEDGALFKIHSNGRDFRLKPECFAVLNGDENEPLNIKNCREHYVSNICSEHGYKLSVNKDGGSIEYFVTKK
jgi:histidine phosphotransferase ChpT